MIDLRKNKQLKQWANMTPDEKVSYLKEKIKLFGPNNSWSNPEWCTIVAYNLLPNSQKRIS